MLHTVMAFLPLAFLIVYALKTRKMADAMVLATLLAVLLVHRQHFFTGLIDAMYTTLGNSSYQFALCSILGFGGMISLFQASGGLMASGICWRRRPTRPAKRCCWRGCCL